MLPLLVGIAAIAVASGVPAVHVRARREALRAARAAARSESERLGFCVETLSGGNDQVAIQALVDAEQRWNTAGALESTANTREEFAVAEETAREGLRFVAAACLRLGQPVPDVEPS